MNAALIAVASLLSSLGIGLLVMRWVRGKQDEAVDRAVAKLEERIRAERRSTEQKIETGDQLAEAIEEHRLALEREKTRLREAADPKVVEQELWDEMNARKSKP